MSENQGGLKKKSELLEGEDTLTVCWVEHAFQAMTNNLHQLGHQWFDWWGTTLAFGEHLTRGNRGCGEGLRLGCKVGTMKQSSSSKLVKDASIIDSRNLSYRTSRLYEHSKEISSVSLHLLNDPKRSNRFIYIESWEMVQNPPECSVQPRRHVW